MRELRVEDALLYLDQVKMEFGDRPHIYNQFLDIMKTFKSQQIDTPGVIQRVSSLFHGNKKLVLGFNTFLPEGYKIELPMDGAGQPVAVYRAPGQTGVTQILGPGSSPSSIGAPPPAPPPSGPQGGPSAAGGAATAAGSSQPPAVMAQQQVAQSQQAPGGSAGRPGVPSHHQQSMVPSQQPSQRHGASASQHQHGPSPAHQQPHPAHTTGHPPPHAQPGLPHSAQPQQQGPVGPPSMQRGQQQGQQGQQGPSPQRQQQQGARGGVGSIVVDQPASPGNSSASYQQRHLPMQQAQQQALHIQHAQQVQAQITQQQQQQQQPPSQQMLPANDAASRSRITAEQQSRSIDQPPQQHAALPAQHHHHQQQSRPSGVQGGVVSGQQQQQAAVGSDRKVGVTSRMGPGPGGPHSSALPAGGSTPHPGAVGGQPNGLPVAPPLAHSHTHQQVQPLQQQQLPQQQQQQQQPPPQQQTSQQPPPQQPAVEFDHAINYVTTIKKRFASEPETYKKFLEILHTYQKEQRGIKEVLDEVSRLFADHPDLLKEFTYFLPDAVQAQAKAQLEQMAKLAEARKRAMSAKQAIMQTARQVQQSPQQGQHPVQGSIGAGGSLTPGGGAVATGMAGAGTAIYAPAPAPVPFGATQGRTEEREREICRSAIYGLVSFAPVRPPRRNELSPAQAALKYGRPRMIPEPPVQPTTAEATFFERAKHHLNRKELAPDKPPGSRRHTPHTEFLKCLHLFGAGILNKEELLLLLRGLFIQGHAPKSGVNAGGGASNPAVANEAQDLLREFEEILVGRGPYAEQESLLKDKSKYGSLPARDFDFSQSEQPTPSYRTFPADYNYNQFFSHSGQSDADASVLNTSVVCVAPERSGISKQKMTYSPEDYDGPKMRRNVYEDALFKVEDERFEVDMAIERNASAMRQIEPLAGEATLLRENEEKDGQPIGRMHYQLRNRSLSSTHLGAIARLYGDSGDEVIHHLARNPIAVLPIVFRRLREKDLEWRKARTDLSKQWKLLTEANFEGSLDILCYFYKREVERSFATEQLLEECKRARYFAKHPRKLNPHPAARSIAPDFSSSCLDAKAVLFQSHIRLDASNSMPHKDAYECLTMHIMNGVAKTNADREKVSRVWAEFIAPWFDLPVHWFLEELRQRIRSDKSSCVVKYAPGQRVRTAFGDGQIISMIEGNHNAALRYKVKLPFGTSYVRPSAVIHLLPSTTKAQYARSGGFMEFVERPDDRMDGNEVKLLDKNCHLVFGTEKMYVFMRLYCLLVRLLSESKSHLKNLGPVHENTRHLVHDSQSLGIGSIHRMEGVDPFRTSGFPKGALSGASDKKHINLGYRNLKDALKQYIRGDIDAKMYESSCRTLTKGKVFQLAAIPKLLEKCADAMVKVAREDVALTLFDYSQLKHMDPVLLRSQCLGITSDASFRIQYDPIHENMYFSFLPVEVDLLTTPRAGSVPSAVGGNGGGDPALNGDAEERNATPVDDEYESEVWSKEQLQPQTKRLKLK